MHKFDMFDTYASVKKKDKKLPYQIHVTVIQT